MDKNVYCVFRFFFHALFQNKCIEFFSKHQSLLFQGLLKEAFQTASGVYQTCWERYGMAYQTPEAFRKNRTYRSLAYMRPLSIWGMQYAIENLRKSKVESVES